MLITKGQSQINLPDDWKQTDEKNPDYFVSPDGTKGIYVSSHEKYDVDDDRKVVEFVRKIEKTKTKSMKGYKFRTYSDSVSSTEDPIVGNLDEYDSNKNYRIVTKFIVKQQKIFRAALHDYDCTEYEDSKSAFDSILDSFIYLPKYSWKPTDGGRPEFGNDLIISKEEGFVDVNLHIVSYTANRDVSFLIKVSNNIEGRAVGFKILLDKKWTSKKIENSKSSLFWGTGKFISTGQPTETFVEVLSGLYGFQNPEFSMNEVNIVVVGLANDPRKLATRDTKMKVFFNSDNQELYSEVFINVNLSEKSLEFHEKDEEYRQPLIRSLCGER
ncbi:MAG: hypothetical protein J0L75_21125 [Spirochaetes bacterium]|nr:hypothetical protein [Spirochaetota bacterium]